MSHCLRILCQSDSPLFINTITDFIEEGVYFDDDVEFNPAPQESKNPDWEQLEIVYEQGKRPIIITNTSSGNLFTEEIQELTDENAATAKSLKVQKHLKSTRRIIGIDIDVVHLSEEAWFMLDHLESFLATQLHGIIYAPDEGYYDASLDLIACVTPTDS